MTRVGAGSGRQGCGSPAGCAFLGALLRRPRAEWAPLCGRLLVFFGQQPADCCRLHARLPARKEQGPGPAREGWAGRSLAGCTSDCGHPTPIRAARTWHVGKLGRGHRRRGDRSPRGDHSPLRAGAAHEGEPESSPHSGGLDSVHGGAGKVARRCACVTDVGRLSGQWCVPIAAAYRSWAEAGAGARAPCGERAGGGACGQRSPMQGCCTHTT